MKLEVKQTPRAPDHPPQGRSLIEVRDLTKRFGSRVVLDGLCLDVARGETLVIIGGSGSGKSTFARLLVGLERPTSGHIFVDGVDVPALNDRELLAMRRRFAMVFQRHALLDSMSVFDNVAFPLREETNFDEHVISEKVMRVLDELDIDDAAKKLPGQLSGGMAKRVGIARAVVTEPEIIVYDEPTSGLDPVSARMVDGLIERMRQVHFVTSIVITHDMVTAYDVADRVALLAGGKIMAAGEPVAMFTSHSEAFEPFAVASGIDLRRLGPRAARRSADEIRAAWLASKGLASTLLDHPT